MRAFPLIRTKWSNEHIMAALLVVLLLYHVPEWVLRPAAIMDTLIVLAFGLTVDAAASFLRYKRPVCAVSGGVTALLLHLLTPGVPLWAELIGVAFALLAGKHLWGGTGKNPLNPALIGVLPLALLFNVPFPAFDSSLLLLPAVLLSLPFLIVRPWPSLGMMAGMAAALLARGEATLPGMLAYGVALWGCLVVTDPITMTPRPMAGGVIGLLAGFVPLAVFNSVAAMAAGVLTANLLSIAADRLALGVLPHMKPRFRHAPVDADTSFHDLTGKPSSPTETEAQDLPAEEILKRVEQAGVFGYGGAAFPTARKLRTVMASAAPARHLVINAVECDPGLIHDKWLLHHRTGDIMRGIELLCRCVPFETVTLAIKHAEPNGFTHPVKVRIVPDSYPAGAEKILVRDLLGLPLPEGAIPAESGILVLNVQTVLAIYEAAVFGSAADTRYLSLADTRSGQYSVARVRLGASIQETLHTVYPGASPVFSGGGIMQSLLAHEDAVIDQSVNFIAAGLLPKYKDSPQCSRCGLCAAVCPAHLPVADIAQHMRDGQPDRAMALHPDACMACGSCSRVCLAGRNLSASVAEAKERVKPA